MTTMTALNARLGGDALDQLALKPCLSPEELDQVEQHFRRLERQRGQRSRALFLGVLARYLSDARDDDVRIAAINALSRTSMRTAAAQKLMLRALSDRSWLVRVEATEIAADARAKFATSPLRRLLRDRNKLVRGYAADALAHVAGRECEADLRKRLVLERQPWVRARIYGALLFLGDASTIADLKRLARSPDHLTAAIAARALGSYTPREHAREIVQFLQCLLEGDPPIGLAEVISGAITELSRSARPTRRTRRPS
jgi:HEAT repeat protein